MNLITILFLILIFFPSTAYAYIDPGTGGMLLQGLLAALFAGIITIKGYWKLITGYFKKKDGDD